MFRCPQKSSLDAKSNMSNSLRTALAIGHQRDALVITNA